MCLRGRGKSTVPGTLVWRRSQYGTEQERDDCSSDGARLKTTVSGILQAWDGTERGEEETREYNSM